MPTPLPTLDEAQRDYVHLRRSTAVNSLYQSVLKAEYEAVNAGGDKAALPNLICARIVGWLLLHPLDDTPAPFVREIASGNTSDDFTAKIYETGQMYMQYLIPVFKQHKPAPPTPGERPSRASFTALRRDVLAESQPSPRDHRTAKAQALIRDGFRCMVSGKADGPSIVAELVDYGPSVLTECAHIFPESLGFLEGQCADAKKRFVATVFAMLDRFGYTGVQQELSGTNIHRLENVMTLDVAIHRWFDCMALWFEAIDDRPHSYRIETRPPFVPDASFPREVTFTSWCNLPLPSPKYLRIHAVCCRIAHLSGAAEYMDKIYREEEDLGVLSTDGASAPVLSYLLQRLVDPVCERRPD